MTFNRLFNCRHLTLLSEKNTHTQIEVEVETTSHFIHCLNTAVSGSYLLTTTSRTEMTQLSHSCNQTLECIASNYSKNSFFECC